MEISKLFSVEGKNVLVTGGGTGIGYMIAKGFVNNGANVIISSRKDTGIVAKELEGMGPGKCTSISADITETSAVDQLKQKVAEHTEGRLHVLVNNSGCNWAAPFDKFPKAGFKKVMDLNITAAFEMSQAMMPLLEATASKQDPARIINIGSTDGLHVTVFETYAYAASKAGILHLTKIMAGQLGSRNVTVNAIAPGPFQSKMMRATLKKYGEQVKGSTVLGRIGSEEDMAGTALWLSSRAGAFVTGSTIVVDGGILVRPNL
mmetsp:Transcript_38696/g.50993  ORF Transcript_38696/g.50993 Transcript_38696/m.50993 type:complete len:262 (+) Transcript_38696:76-861(+)|eukprot:CAMPEP_0117851724 /NCGR_PEP_ID=MMETSP0949-20121206/22576_1 /TAXON_ID=44440 /ORGANISM="Chattonella subsalsa, Strain CCMP2191" /LENGTH=261 /DNA_ID=CAMNT_0005699609 /DNA_START=20 /DNA_END=808 /DNA_ORIENTATION=+